MVSYECYLVLVLLINYSVWVIDAIDLNLFTQFSKYTLKFASVMNNELDFWWDTATGSNEKYIHVVFASFDVILPESRNSQSADSIVHDRVKWENSRLNRKSWRGINYIIVIKSTDIAPYIHRAHRRIYTLHQQNW